VHKVDDSLFFLDWFSLHFFESYLFGTPSFSLFFWVVLLWYAIFSLFLTVGHTSLACHLSSLFFRQREIISLRFWSIHFAEWINTCAQELNQKSKLSISLKGLQIWWSSKWYQDKEIRFPMAPVPSHYLIRVNGNTIRNHLVCDSFSATLSENVINSTNLWRFSIFRHGSAFWILKPKIQWRFVKFVTIWPS